MRCSLRAPCGNTLIRMVAGPDFAVVECVHGHSFRIGAPPPNLGTPQRIVRSDAQRHRIYRARNKAKGLCADCGRPRGKARGRGRGATRSLCEACAQRHRAASRRQRRDEHVRQMGGIKKKARA